MESQTTILWRLKNAETRLDSLSATKADNKDVENVKAEMHILSDEVRSLRRSLVVFSLSMVGSGGAFLIGVLALLQQH